MSLVAHSTPFVGVVGIALLGPWACKRAPDVQRAVTTQAIDVAVPSPVACGPGQSLESPRGRLVADSTKPGSYAWWVISQFTPVADTLYTLPLRAIDSRWSKATLLHSGLMPLEAARDLSSLEDSAFGFCFEGDFNADGRRDRVAVGVYETQKGEQGRFLLILTQRPGDHWEKAFLSAAPPDPGFSVLWLAPGAVLRWSFCMECDSWAELEWVDTGYVFKESPDLGEELDTLPETKAPPN